MGYTGWFISFEEYCKLSVSEQLHCSRNSNGPLVPKRHQFQPFLLLHPLAPFFFWSQPVAVGFSPEAITRKIKNKKILKIEDGWIRLRRKTPTPPSTSDIARPTPLCLSYHIRPSYTQKIRPFNLDSEAITSFFLVALLPFPGPFSHAPLPSLARPHTLGLVLPVPVPFPRRSRQNNLFCLPLCLSQPLPRPPNSLSSNFLLPFWWILRFSIPEAPVLFFCPFLPHLFSSFSSLFFLLSLSHQSKSSITTSPPPQNNLYKPSQWLPVLSLPAWPPRWPPRLSALPCVPPSPLPSAPSLVRIAERFFQAHRQSSSSKSHRPSLCLPQWQSIGFN